MSGRVSTALNLRKGYGRIHDTWDEIDRRNDAQAEQEAIEEEAQASETTHLVQPQKTFGIWETIRQGAAGGATTAASSGPGVLSGVAQAANALHVGGIATTAATVGLALSPAAPVAAAISLAQTAVNALDTDNQIRLLKDIQKNLPPNYDDFDVSAALAFAIRKLKDRNFRNGIGPVSGGITSIVCKGRALKKIVQRTKGVERARHAEVLWTKALQNEERAVEICQVLLGTAEYGKLRNDPRATENGWMQLKRAMSST
jgi:hypothetical protein